MYKRSIVIKCEEIIKKWIENKKYIGISGKERSLSLSFSNKYMKEKH